MPGTAAGPGMMQAGNGGLPDGAFTSTIYGLIRDGKFSECIRHLEYELQVRSCRRRRTAGMEPHRAMHGVARIAVLLLYPAPARAASYLGSFAPRWGIETKKNGPAKKKVDLGRCVLLQMRSHSLVLFVFCRRTTQRAVRRCRSWATATTTRATSARPGRCACSQKPRHAFLYSPSPRNASLLSSHHPEGRVLSERHYGVKSSLLFCRRWQTTPLWSLRTGLAIAPRLAPDAFPPSLCRH